MSLFNLLTQTTKDMAGANETALGDDSITRTASGIIALQKASELPLATNKRRFAQWIEDKGLIWLDFWLTHYKAERFLTVNRGGMVQQMPFDGSKYNKAMFNLKIDVGASTQWSESASIQTLDNLLGAKLISFKQYLERVANGLIPKKQELINDIEGQDTDKQVLYTLMADFVQTLPMEIQAQLNMLMESDPEKYENTVKQMILGGGQDEMQPMQQPTNYSEQPI